MGVGPAVSRRTAAAEEAGGGVRGQLQHAVQEGVDATSGTRQGSSPCREYQMREGTVHLKPKHLGIAIDIVFKSVLYMHT